MNHRPLLLPLATLPLLAYAGNGSTPPPNVIFILADDLGIGDIAPYGQEQISTPTLSRLARDGMLFTQHYAGCTVSAPSRGSLLTGLHTGHSYIRGNKNTSNPDGNTYDHPLHQKAYTLGELFQAAGYTTACVGKWGLGGPNTQGHPNAQGFRYFYGYLGQLNAHRHYPQFLHENNTLVQLNGTAYAQELITQKALHFIKEQTEAGHPYFLYYTPTLPHADLHATPQDLAPYQGKFCETPYTGEWYRSTTEPRATFAAMVTRLDSDIARLLALLEELGTLHNTLIIFSSDNGTHSEGGHNPAYFHSSGPFRGSKRSLYEGGIRTPLIVHWPSTIAPGQVSHHISAFWDFLPTFAQLTNTPLPQATDGISLLPTLTGEGTQQTHSYLYWEFHEEGGRQAVRQGEWKLIKQKAKTPHLSYYELYNLHTDPAERQNLAHLYPQVVERLASYIEAAHTPSSIYPLLP